LYAFLFSRIRATLLVHLIFLDLFILIAFGEEYKLWRIIEIESGDMPIIAMCGTEKMQLPNSRRLDMAV
jgi:hypothetical protein